MENVDKGLITVMGSTPALHQALQDAAPGLIPDGIQGGDTKIVWSRSNSDEVANARRTFEDLLSKKFTAFAVKHNGDKGDRIYAFDPNAEHLIMVPPMAGG